MPVIADLTNEALLHKLAGFSAHHELVFSQQGIEFEKINTTELQSHKKTSNSAEPVAGRARTFDSIKGLIRRSMILC